MPKYHPPVPICSWIIPKHPLLLSPLALAEDRCACFHWEKYFLGTKGDKINKQSYVFGDSREELKKDKKKEYFITPPKTLQCCSSLPCIFFKKVVDSTIHFLISLLNHPKVLWCCLQTTTHLPSFHLKLEASRTKNSHICPRTFGGASGRTHITRRSGLKLARRKQYIGAGAEADKS
jgi:hypothetical protein